MSSQAAAVWIHFGPGQTELTNAMLAVPPSAPAAWNLVDAAGLVIRSLPTQPAVVS